MNAATITKKKPEYVWEPNRPTFGDAAAIGAELDRIARKHGVAGLKAVAPEDVARAVEADPARYPALHAAIFEAVSNDEAIARFRVDRVRRIIGSLRVSIIDNGERKLFIPRVSLPVEGKRRYVPVPMAARDKQLREAMVRDCVTTLEGWQRRLRELRQADARPEILAFLEALDEAIVRGRTAAKPGDVPRLTASAS